MDRGLRAGLREWGADATNIYARVRDTSVNAMDGMANSIWQMASRGKSSFKEMALSIIDDIGQMITKMLFFSLSDLQALLCRGPGLASSRILAGFCLDSPAEGIPVMAGSMRLPDQSTGVSGLCHRRWLKAGMLSFLNQLTYGSGYANGGLAGVPSGPLPMTGESQRAAGE